MSDHRPTTSKDDDARMLEAAARERLSVATADLALPDRLRLTEWQRATVRAILDKLVRAIEDELRSSLIESTAIQGQESLHAALSSAHVAIAAPILERSGAHIDRPLVSALIRRAEEHRRFRASGTAQPALLLDLIRDDDEDVAEMGMAILIAQNRRFDPFSDPIAARTELSAELQYRMVWRVAAALRHYIVEQQGFPPAAADEAIVGAAEHLLGGYDEGDSLEARSLRLARLLRDRGRLDDGLIERALSEGALPLFIACLAARSRLGYASTWDILSDPGGRGPVLLLKAAGIARPHAAAILLGLGGTEEEIAAKADLFDVTDGSSARDALRLWQVNPGYREAIAEVAA